jgi:undecaprenyl pyrophosphate phosphatase UppP
MDPVVIDPRDDRLEARERSLRRVALFWILISVAAIVAAIVVYFVGVDWLIDFARGSDAAIFAG